MHIELDAWEQNSQLRPKASLHKGFPQRGRAAERPAPFVGGGRRPPPLWRLAFGLSLEFCSQACKSICIQFMLANPGNQMHGIRCILGPQLRPKQAEQNRTGRNLSFQLRCQGELRGSLMSSLLTSWVHRQSIAY